MCEPGFNAPVHLDVTPRPLNFSPVAADWLRDILPDLFLTSIEKADGVTVPAEAGYYRLTLANGQLLFAKVKTGDRAAKEAKAAVLSSTLNQLGAASLAPERGQVRSDNGLSVFVYPWIEEVFYDESLEGITSLGKSLAHLHMRMRELPGQTDRQRHLFDIWEGRLALTSDLPFADDYRRLLAAVGESFAREASQIAHNDIHRGNVLFDASKVAAFIDFEDAIDTVSSPLVDISASLERFCLLPEASEEKVRAFLASYATNSGGLVAATAHEIAQVGLCRCYNALAILELSRAPDNPLWQAERRKFISLLEKWRRWEQIIALGLQSLRI